MHRKRYCRRYLIVKMVTLVREMLKYVKLNEIVNGILRQNKTIKFRAVKQLISDVFWDKHAEVDLCETAASISYKALAVEHSFNFGLKSDGIAFKYTKCDICSLNVC